MINKLWDCPLKAIILAIAVALPACCSSGSTRVTHQVFATWYPATNAQGDPVAEVYESRVPCLDAEGVLLSRCEKVKLAIALYRTPASHKASTYAMSRVYVGDDSNGERRTASGSWRIDERAGRRIYELDGQAPADFRAYWAISDKVLFVLDRDGEPRPGTAGYGYALNRVYPPVAAASP